MRPPMKAQYTARLLPTVYFVEGIEGLMKIKMITFFSLCVQVFRALENRKRRRTLKGVSGRANK